MPCLDVHIKCFMHIIKSMYDAMVFSLDEEHALYDQFLRTVSAAYEPA